MKNGDELRDPDGPQQFALDGWIDTGPFEKLCGMDILDASQGEANLRMEFKVKLSNGAGLMHGGALAALADTAVAMAIKSLLPEGSHFVTKKFSCVFLAPVRKGVVVAHARVLKQNGPELETETIVTDEDGREVARLTAPFKVLREGRRRPDNYTA